MGKQNFDNGKKLLTYCVVYQYYYCIISYKVINKMSNKRKLYLFMRTTVRTIFFRSNHDANITIFTTHFHTESIDKHLNRKNPKNISVL